MRSVLVASAWALAIFSISAWRKRMFLRENAKEAQYRELDAQHEELKSLIKSLLWCIAFQSEKVPGKMRRTLDIVCPYISEGARYEMSERILKRIQGRDV